MKLALIRRTWKMISDFGIRISDFVLLKEVDFGFRGRKLTSQSINTEDLTR